jgi:hypothetical protein
MTGATRSDGDGRGESLSLDAILELLSQYQRREMIRHLRDAPGNVHSVDELVAHLADVERRRPGDSPGEDHLLSVLVHIHGPKLEAAGLIDYDLPSREVRYHPNERIERALDLIDELDEEL